MSTVERLSSFRTGELLDLDVAGVAQGQGGPAHFDRCGYLPLPGFLTERGLRELQTEVARLVPTVSRKDFRMACMDNTPRHMSTLSGVTIEREAPGIAKIYRDDQLREALAAAVGLPLTLADDPIERHVLNILHRSGDTHGFHVDDYPLALVVFIESPVCAEGCGRLEFCPVDAPHDGALAAHHAGDAYMLRADLLRHRVQPIHDGCRRTVLNFAYGVDGHTVRSTRSANLLYDEVAPTPDNS